MYKVKSGGCITEVDHAKDLGVTLSSNGNFKEHIKNVLSTANQLYNIDAGGYFGHLIRGKHYP